MISAIRSIATRSKPVATTIASCSGWRTLTLALLRAARPSLTVCRATLITSSSSASRGPATGKSQTCTLGSEPSRLS